MAGEEIEEEEEERKKRKEKKKKKKKLGVLCEITYSDYAAWVQASYHHTIITREEVWEDLKVAREQFVLFEWRSRPSEIDERDAVDEKKEDKGDVHSH